jgi:hypothetical protein
VLVYSSSESPSALAVFLVREQVRHGTQDPNAARTVSFQDGRSIVRSCASPVSYGPVPSPQSSPEEKRRRRREGGATEERDSGIRLSVLRNTWMCHKRDTVTSNQQQANVLVVVRGVQLRFGLRRSYRGEEYFNGSFLCQRVGIRVRRSQSPLPNRCHQLANQGNRYSHLFPLALPSSICRTVPCISLYLGIFSPVRYICSCQVTV